ncbi:MAG: DsbA family protein [Hyphomicrobiaceae bacterium]|nr:DsbA family protein [Hyphomicrobiaceae bacterium]
MSQQATAPRHLVYFADPMCSWCWGFAPVINGLADHFGDRLPISLIIGGLRPGTREAMSDEMKSDIRGHWQKVAERTGQPFDLSFFDREGFVYDTEPADRAAIVMRLLNPLLALPYFTAIQRAFYAENRDVTDESVLADIAAEHGIDREQFLVALATNEARKATVQDFDVARASGVTGFPTLYAGTIESGYAMVTTGYRPLDGLPQILEEWLATPDSGPDGNSNARSGSGKAST